MTTDDKKLNRLRAAAALLPQIEAGLSDGKLTHEKAALSAEFCQWALSDVPESEEARKHAAALETGLARLKSVL